MSARPPTAHDDGTTAPVPVLIAGRREMMFRCTAPNCPKAYRQASDLRTHNQLRHPTAASTAEGSSMNLALSTSPQLTSHASLINSAANSSNSSNTSTVGGAGGSPMGGNTSPVLSSTGGVMDEIRNWLASPRVALPPIAISQLVAMLEPRKKFRVADLRGWDEASFRNIGFNQSVHIPKLVRALEAEFGTPIRSSPMLQPRMPPPALHSPASTPSPMVADDNYVALPLNRLNGGSPSPSGIAGGVGGGGGGGGIADEDHYVDLRLGPTMPLPPLPPLPSQKSPAPAPIPPVRPLSPRQPAVVDHYNVFPTSERAKSTREVGSAEVQARQLQRRNTAASVSQPNMHVLSAPPIAGLPGVGMNAGLPVSPMRVAHSPRVPSVQQSPMRRSSPLPPQAPSSPVPQPNSSANAMPGTPQNVANANYSVIALPESDEGEADPRKRWYYHDVRRDEAEAMLRGRAAGTFVMRPSSQAQFALTFVTDRQDFGHALVYHLPQGWQLESLAEFHPTLDALLQKYTLLNWEESRRLVFNVTE